MNSMRLRFILYAVSSSKSSDSSLRRNYQLQIRDQFTNCNDFKFKITIKLIRFRLSNKFKLQIHDHSRTVVLKSKSWSSSADSRFELSQSAGSCSNFSDLEKIQIKFIVRNQTFNHQTHNNSSASSCKFIIKFTRKEIEWSNQMFNFRSLDFNRNPPTAENMFSNKKSRQISPKSDGWNIAGRKRWLSLIWKLWKNQSPNVN